MAMSKSLSDRSQKAQAPASAARPVWRRPQRKAEPLVGLVHATCSAACSNQGFCELHTESGDVCDTCGC